MDSLGCSGLSGNCWVFLLQQTVPIEAAMMLSVPPAGKSMALREKVKFAPSLPEQRVGPSSCWTSVALEMFRRLNYIKRLAYSSYIGYIFNNFDPNMLHTVDV